MAKNLGRKYATMDDEERRRFAMKKNEDGTDSAQADLEFDDPRTKEPGDDADEPRDQTPGR